MVEFSSLVLRVFIMTINNKSERNYRGKSASVGLLLATAVGKEFAPNKRSEAKNKTVSTDCTIIK